MFGESAARIKCHRRQTPAAVTPAKEGDVARAPASDLLVLSIRRTLTKPNRVRSTIFQQHQTVGDSLHVSAQKFVKSTNPIDIVDDMKMSKRCRPVQISPHRNARPASHVLTGGRTTRREKYDARKSPERVGDSLNRMERQRRVTRRVPDGARHKEEIITSQHTQMLNLYNRKLIKNPEMPP